ncbi:hypothetical protein ACFLVN_04055 [Chloroflexota bacterium]
MNRARRPIMHSLVAISVTAIMIVAGMAPAFAQQGDEIQVTDSEVRADQPDVAVDSNGNVHIVYFDEYETSYREIWYTMLDQNGNTLIDDTRMSTDNDESSKHPTIVVDSNDMVHIVWAESGKYHSIYEIWYTKLDPGQDDQDGDAADPAAITLVDDIALTDLDTYLTHPRIAVDSNDHIHIVWEEDTDDVYYMKIDNNGNELVAAKVIRWCSLNWYGRPYVAMDSNDNAHITWNDDADTDTYEIYYMMLDGSNGNTLIDATLLTPDDDERSKRQTIVVDRQDMVHIIWADYRPTGENEIFHTKLDPSRDDQDGDAADEGVITVIDDTMLTTDDGDYSFNPQSAIQCGRYIHVAWYDNYDSSYDIFYMVLDTNGNILVPVQVLTTTNSVSYTTENRDNQPSLDVHSEGKAHITWCDDRTGYNEVWSTNYQWTSCAVGVEASPINKVTLLMPWIALAAAIVAGGIILARRRAHS